MKPREPTRIIDNWINLIKTWSEKKLFSTFLTLIIWGVGFVPSSPSESSSDYMPDHTKIILRSMLFGRLLWNRNHFQRIFITQHSQKLMRKVRNKLTNLRYWKDWYKRRKCLIYFFFFFCLQKERAAGVLNFLFSFLHFCLVPYIYTHSLG